MPKTKEYVRWAIVGEVGLYVGQFLTRKDAIEDHLKARYGIDSAWGRGLSTTHLEFWHKCQAKGDRAVKVRILVPVGNSLPSGKSSQPADSAGDRTGGSK